MTISHLLALLSTFCECSCQEWDEGKKEVPSLVQAGDQFGHSVAIFNDVIVVGAYHPERPYVGSVYIYTMVGNDFSTPQKIMPIDNMWFGLSVGVMMTQL